MSPSGEKQLPLEPSVERILCQGLNVVATQSSSYAGSDVNLKKIAKKRRGAGGAVDVEYTKSSIEYLQKAQQSLRQESGNNSSAEFSSNSNPSSRANESLKNTATDQSSSNPYGYEDPDAAPRKLIGPAHRSFSQPAISSAGSPYGYGDPAASNPYGYGDAPPSKNPYGYGDTAKSNPYGYGDAAPSNPYGYENPDSAPTIRRRGPARRRGSVTKFSVQAAAAASAVTDRILQKTNLLSQRNSGDAVNKPMRRSTCAHVPSSDGRFNRMSPDNGKRNDSPPIIFDRPSSGDMKPTTPKRQASFGDPLEKAKQAQSGSTGNIVKPNESFGTSNKQTSKTGRGSPMALDGFENSKFTVAAPQRPRPRRRGPAFKLSEQPQAMDSEVQQQGPISSFPSPVQNLLNAQKTPASSLGPEMETSLNDVHVSEARWSLVVPDQSLGHRVPQRSSSNHSFKKQFMSPKRSGSLRSLSRAAANLRKDKGENSMHDSVGSVASWDDNSFHGPQAAKYQSPNWRRKYARSNSVGSIGSEGDSLASDMESLCSISVRTDDRPGLPSPAPSFKKCVVSRTPSKVSRHNSNGSLFGSRPKDNSNDDGSVSALKALNLENTSKQSFGVARAANPNAVCRSYSGDRLRVLRDQKVVREQH